MSNQHVLKIHPAPLADLMSGAKTAEVRRNDRDFQVGDTVRLIEVNPETLNWTGRPDLVRTISHIQTGYGLPDGICVLSYADTAQREALAQLEAKHATWMEQYDSVVRYGNELLAKHDTAQAQLAEAVGLIEKSADLSGELGDYLVSLAKRHSGTELLDHERNLRAFLARNAQAEQQEARAALATQPAAGEPVRVVVEPGEELSPSNLVGNRIDRMFTIGTRLYTAPPAAAHGDDAPGTVRVTADWLKTVHRDLDACQKVIWLAGCRPRVPGGFDPAYCKDAQARLKEIDEHIARAQGDGGAA